VNHDGEEATLARLAAHLGPGAKIGDDAAWLDTAGLASGQLVATVDSQIDGVHVRCDRVAPQHVARRLVAVNASDLAASGALPRLGLLALAAPPGYDVDSFLAATAESLAQLGAELVGGDLARADQLVATLTLLGVPARRGPLLARSAARPGDRLWLGGTVGESAVGCALVAAGGGWRATDPAPHLPPGLVLEHRDAAQRALHRHLAPTPQLALGQHLAGLPRCAALDLSDGLAKDLTRLATASGVGATVDLAALPFSADYEVLCQHLDLDPLGLGLGGGEDYVLLVATAPAHNLTELGLVPIGWCESEPGLRARTADRAVRPLESSGWDHLGRLCPPAPKGRQEIAQGEAKRSPG
jgi:thiamine-monophosphate kinase